MIENRDDYITGCVVNMHEAGTPGYIVEAFAREAAERPNEYPMVTRDKNEIYPDAASWQSRTRRYELGILHWEWADGSGFPPSDAEKNRNAERALTATDAAKYLLAGLRTLGARNGR